MIRFRFLVIITFLSMCIAGVLVFSEEPEKNEKHEQHNKTIHNSDNQLNVDKTQYSDTL